MTYAQALAYIEAWIIDNNNKEITASIMRDVLEKMLLYVNDSVGDVGSLNEGNNVVEAVNILFGMIDNLQVDFPIQVHTGSDNPNTTPPVGFSAPDFYIRNGTQTYIYTGMSWVLIQDTSTSDVPSLELVVQEGNTTSRRLIGLDFFKNKADYEFAQIRDLKNAVFEGVNIPGGTLGNIQNLNNTNNYLWSPFILNTHFASKEWVSLQDFITSTNANNLFVKRTFEIEGVGGLQGGGVMNDTRIEISLTTDSVNKLNRGNTAWGWGNHALVGYAMPYTAGSNITIDSNNKISSAYPTEGTKLLVEQKLDTLPRIWSAKTLSELLDDSYGIIKAGAGIDVGGVLSSPTGVTISLASNYITSFNNIDTLWDWYLVERDKDYADWTSLLALNYAKESWVTDNFTYTAGSNISIDSNNKISSVYPEYGTKLLYDQSLDTLPRLWSVVVLEEIISNSYGKINQGSGIAITGNIASPTGATISLSSENIIKLNELGVIQDWYSIEKDKVYLEVAFFNAMNLASQQWVLDKNYITSNDIDIYTAGSNQQLVLGNSTTSMVWSPSVLTGFFSPKTHKHAILKTGVGLAGSDYDGSTARTWQLDEATQNDIAKGVTAEGLVNNKVSKSGDTMTGRLTLDNALYGEHLRLFRGTYRADITMGANGHLALEANDYLLTGLSGTGSRMVVVSPSGVLGTNLIPSLSNYYTKTESLNQFVGLSGVQNIADTKTFTSSPVVPLGTLGSHAARLSQITDYGLGRKSTNLADITSEDIQYGRIFRSLESGHVGSIISLPFDGSGSGRTNLFRVYSGNAYISTSLVSEGTAPSWRELWHTGNLGLGQLYDLQDRNTSRKVWTGRVLHDFVASMTADAVQTGYVDVMPTDITIPLNNVQGTVYSGNARDKNITVSLDLMTAGGWAAFKYRTTGSDVLKTVANATQVRGSSPRPNTTYTLFVYCTSTISSGIRAEYCYIED